MRHLLLKTPSILTCIIIMVASCKAMGQPSSEVLLSATENAYNPIPNPDATLIAYVRTGWGRPGGTGGFGRSNLVSEIMLVTASGEVVSRKPLADAFLYGWSRDGKYIISFRDGKYSIVSPEGNAVRSGRLPQWSDYYDVSERIAFLANTNLVLWVQNDYTNIKRVATSPSSEYMTRDFVRSVLQSPEGEVARFSSELHADEMLVPSPNERYLALVRTAPRGESEHLWVYDRQNKSWADLGEIIIHPDEAWDYINPAWDPWFADSSRVTYLSAMGVVISSPNGKTKRIVSRPKGAAGLVAPSPDGEYIAYATFESRPMKQRPDLKFWGGSTIWVIPVAPNSMARPVTRKDRDTTYSLHWLGGHQLVFDRVADEMFYGKARLWKVDVPR